MGILAGLALDFIYFALAILPIWDYKGWLYLFFQFNLCWRCDL